MRKTNKPAKSVDHDDIQGPRRKKPTKRYELWFRSRLSFGSREWIKIRTYELQEDAVGMGEKRVREFDHKHMDYKVVDKMTKEVIWQSTIL